MGWWRTHLSQQEKQKRATGKSQREQLSRVSRSKQGRLPRVRISSLELGTGKEFPGHPIASQAQLHVLPAGGSVVLRSEQRPPSGLEREVNYRYSVGPLEDPRTSLTQGLPHGCHSVSLESSLSKQPMTVGRRRGRAHLIS